MKGIFPIIQRTNCVFFSNSFRIQKFSELRSFRAASLKVVLFFTHVFMSLKKKSRKIHHRCWILFANFIWFFVCDFHSQIVSVVIGCDHFIDLKVFCFVLKIVAICVRGHWVIELKRLKLMARNLQNIWCFAA